MFGKKKRKPFTVRVCWLDGKEESFLGIIYWEWQANGVLRIVFEKQQRRDDIFLPVFQIRHFSGRD